jgi:tRNA(adenine34) deaminase
MRPHAGLPDCDVPVSRRSVLAGSVATSTLAVAAPMTTFAAVEDDERFMRIAIDEARRADFPFGAVIVQGGRIIARGRNLGRSQDDPTETARWLRSGAVSPRMAAPR